MRIHKRKVLGMQRVSGSRRQATLERPVAGLSTTPHKLGLWGSGEYETVQNACDRWNASEYNVTRFQQHKTKLLRPIKTKINHKSIETLQYAN